MIQLALNAKISNIINLIFSRKNKAFVNTISHRKNSDIKKDIRQHLKDAKEVN